MTVQELIDKLNEVKDKTIKVYIPEIGGPIEVSTCSIKKSVDPSEREILVMVE